MGAGRPPRGAVWVGGLGRGSALEVPVADIAVVDVRHGLAHLLDEAGGVLLGVALALLGHEAVEELAAGAELHDLGGWG